MGGGLHKLSTRRVVTESKSGRHSDGGGLYLVVAPRSRKWLFIFRRAGKQREMGLGSASGPHAVSLADARARAAECRAVLARGGDPIERRREQTAQVPVASVPTFGAFAESYIAAHRASWRNAKHAAQWQTTLSTYAESLQSKLVNAITRDDVLAVLRPIWITKNETASRLRGRIEMVLDAAKAEGLRSGENPAAWKGNLKHSLPKRQKLQRGHHAAMPYEKVPTFVQCLPGREATAARALEFLILTAARSGEVLGARWNEIDRDRGVWVVPAARMKAGREHRVPLADSAIAVLVAMEALREGAADLVFPSRDRRPLSNMAMEMLLRRLKVEDATVHGFRSSFRDWAAEETPFAREVAEAALAHVVGGATERAYRRGDALERRRALMQAWADYLRSQPARA